MTQTVKPDAKIRRQDSDSDFITANCRDSESKFSLNLPTHSPNQPLETPTHTIDGLKFMSWNIQSKNSTTLGNKFAIERFEKIVRNHDIICLQETRSNVELKDYVVFNSIRKNSQRSGGGVSVLVRKEFSRNVTPFYCKNLSDVMAIKISHKMIDRPWDLILVCCYLAPIASKYRKALDTNIWDTVNDFVNTLSSKGKIFLCGDLNARSGNLSDLLIPSKPILSNPLSHSLPPELNIESYDHEDMVSTIPPRNNQDTVINSDGRALLDLCTSNNIHILNGRTIGDLFGSHTLHNIRGSTCIDYFLAPTDCRSLIKSLKVLDFTEFSDHCPLSLNLSLRPTDSGSPPLKSCNTRTPEALPNKFIINKNSVANFSKKLCSLEFQQRFSDFEVSLSQEIQSTSVEYANDAFSEILVDCANQSLKTINPDSCKNRKHKQKWHDNCCKQQKNLFRKSVNNLNKFKKNIDPKDPRVLKDLVRNLYSHKKACTTKNFSLQKASRKKAQSGYRKRKSNRLEKV